MLLLLLVEKKIKFNYSFKNEVSLCSQINQHCSYLVQQNLKMDLLKMKKDWVEILLGIMVGLVSKNIKHLVFKIFDKFCFSVLHEF